MKTALAGLIAGSFLIAAVPWSTGTVAQETSELASYAPEGALMYGEVELDPESNQIVLAKELLERANLEALLTAEQQEEFESGLALAEQTFNGQAAFFFGPIDPAELAAQDIAGEAAEVADDPLAATEDLPSGWAVVLQPDNPQFIYDLLLQSLVPDEAANAVVLPDATPDAATSSGSGYETETYEGYDIAYIPAGEDVEGRALALVDDVVVAASTTEDVKKVIDVVNGTTAPLADDQSFQDVRALLPEETLAVGYIDGPAWLDLIEAAEPAELEQIPEEMLASYAAHQGYAVWAEEAGFRLDAVALAGEGTTLATPDAYDAAFTEIVPDTSMIYAGGMALGQQPALEFLALSMAMEIAGIDTETMQTPAVAEAQAEEIFAEAEEVLGFNLKTDVLDQLTGEWAVAGTTDLMSGSAIFISEIEDPAVVTNVTDQITELVTSDPEAPVDVSTRDVNGSQVTVLEVQDETTPLTIEYGVVDEQLVIGLNGWLDYAAEPAEAPLAESQAFQDTMAELPEEFTSLTYVNVQELLPLVEFFASQAATSTVDADPACGDYASQEEAQEAFDEDQFENNALDQDWDGIACEDYFAPATPVAQASGISDINILSIGAVTWVDGDTRGTSAIVLIGD